MLTLNVVDTPEPWLVETHSAASDLDNIRLLEDTKSTLRAEYKLTSILIAGSCYESKTEQPPAGLSLVLDTSRLSHVTDTLVMANLGYWQLKAHVGGWFLKLAQGRASHVFRLTGSNSVFLPMLSFNPANIPIRVDRMPGMENADHLVESENSDAASKQGIWDSVSRMLGRSNEDRLNKDDDTVHVFSIASGMLYERFLKIMMLSVRNNTQSNVKFWFIANFLSPQFKETAPKIAAKHNFTVEFVTYKWPQWLRRQTEKQRVIWGYKILFLDVLFPLSVKKVIFIDADQVVRGDVNDLVKMNLHGAPYAFTPFCDSNKDVEGFRFWKQGYWSDHLRGKSYHISALYVVDLQRFRRMKAGDSLRAIYDNLSADPNSLANLDQDLPNYAQHMVPIHSLPQEWLWCATWCSMETLPQAKTIDLCNNPMTKEPKIVAAKRIIPEWTTLDELAKEASTSNSNRIDNIASSSKPKSHDEL